MRSPQLLAAGSVGINMTPMIDVVFLLIIFFLVSSHLAKQENAIKLDLPTATSVLADQSEQDKLVINVLPSGDFSVAGGSISIERLTQMMRQRHRESGGQLQVRIRTDRLVPYEKIEPILGAAAECGCTDIVFAAFEDLRPR